MNNKTATFLLVILFPIVCFGQNLTGAENYTIKSAVDNYIFSIGRIPPPDSGLRKSTSNELLMTGQGLNVFMAKRVDSVLIGSSDLTLNKGYFTLDLLDGRLSLGYNMGRDPAKTLKPTKVIQTIGVAANSSEGIATLFSGEDGKLVKEIGATYKLSLLGKGKINYDASHFQRFGITGRSQVEIAELYREEIKGKLYYQMAKDSLEFEASIKDIDDNSYKAERRNSYYNNKVREYQETFVKLEADKVYDEGLFTSYSVNWLSFDFYVPITTQTFTVSPDFAQKLNDKSLYNFRGIAIWNNIYERKPVMFTQCL